MRAPQFDRATALRRITLGVARSLAILPLCLAFPAGADRPPHESPTPEQTRRLEQLSELSFAELLEVPMSTPAALLATELRRTPGSVTILDQAHIRASGARDLDELLDIYVPGFQFMKKLQTNMMGFRGIISDRNNKILMLVNGRNMNIKTRDGGALTERHLSMLGDIRQITIVRGLGSAVSGPGAIAGVIHIETYDGLSFEGFETHLRGGAEEVFGSWEARFGKKLTDEIGLFLYYGGDDYKGADDSDAPQYFSTDFTTFDGTPVRAEHKLPVGSSNRNQSYDNRLRHKAHLQLTGYGFDFWARYTRGGVRGDLSRRN